MMGGRTSIYLHRVEEMERPVALTVPPAEASGGSTGSTVTVEQLPRRVNLEDGRQTIPEAVFAVPPVTADGREGPFSIGAGRADRGAEEIRRLQFPH